MISFHITWVKNTFAVSVGLFCGAVLIVAGMWFRFEHIYESRVYPGIVTETINLAGKTPAEVNRLFAEKNGPFSRTSLTLQQDGFIATISAEQLDVKLDGDLIGEQAYMIGRTGHFLTDARFHTQSFVYATLGIVQQNPLVSLPAPLVYNTEIVDEKLEYARTYLDIEPVETLFEFDEQTNRVTAFKLGKEGRKSDMSSVKDHLIGTLLAQAGENIVITIPVETVYPKSQALDSEELGIVELLAEGESYFTDSIPGRVYNIELATSRVNGVLVPPGEIFSFNDTIGDITAATGYKSAYVIKNGKTILDDGGGVCQVSTTVFRAALNAGLEIVDRSPHSYRVSYYEQGGFKPGLDATVYPPYTDLKIRNNTNAHILLTAEFDAEKEKLTYRIYGKDDGRVVEISDMRLWDYADPPPPSYQEDPTLTTGTIKQIERATPGIKAAFDYKVVKGGEFLSDMTIASSFTPWQAVYLYGPGTEVPQQ